MDPRDHADAASRRLRLFEGPQEGEQVGRVDPSMTSAAMVPAQRTPQAKPTRRGCPRPLRTSRSAKNTRFAPLARRLPGEFIALALHSADGCCPIGLFAKTLRCRLKRPPGRSRLRKAGRCTHYGNKGGAAEHVPARPPLNGSS